MYDDYKKRRRNFMVIGLVLFFYKYGGLKFERLSILGNEAVLEDPNVVGLFLAGAWFYWMFRFVHSFLEIEDKGIKAAFYVQLGNSANTIAKKLFKKQQLEPPNGKTDWIVERKGSNITKQSLDEYKISISYIWRSPDRKRSTDDRSHTIIVKRNQLIFPILYKGIYILLTKRYFLEYVFPMIIGFLPAIYFIKNYLKI